MSRFLPNLILTVLCSSLITAPTFSQNLPEANPPSDSSPRHVILIIGDGMDDTQLTLARNYLTGAHGRLVVDKLPYHSSVQVLTLDEQNPKLPLYVADSANSATAIATGHATSRGRIATSAKRDRDLTTIAELAKKAGMATGIVTTASVTDATPAAFISHINLRGCQNPERMLTSTSLDKTIVGCQQDLKANGGAGSIAEQIADGDTDIVLGGGRKNFDKTAELGSTTLIEQAEANGFQVMTQPDQLKKINSEQKVLGLFDRRTMEVRLQGEEGRIAEAPKRKLKDWLSWSPNTATLPAPMKCEPNPEYGNTPSLPKMTQVALKHLQARGGDQGFFLMVESASIDKQSHRRNPCGQIGEVEQLNESVQAALNFAKANSNTLILVTADHGHAAQIIPNRSKHTGNGEYSATVRTFTPGRMVRLITPEGQIMAINYATNDDSSEDHTGTSVPLYSNLPLPAMVQQPELFQIMKRYLEQ